MMKETIKLLLNPWFLLCIVAVVNCAPEDTAAAKFTALAQEMGSSDNVLLRAFGEGYLIGKVSFKEWKILYGYEDNNGCDGAFTGEAEKELKQAVSESLRVWMSPLIDIAGDKQLIDVNNVQYVQRDTMFKQAYYYPDWTAKSHRFIIDDSERFSFALAIIFYCDEGRSFVDVPELSGAYFPHIHMFPSSFAEYILARPEHRELNEKNYLPPLKTEIHQAYQRTALHHEMGHAFGLGDIYVGYTNRRFAQSTGGSHFTAGKQPVSVMAMNNLVGLTPDGKLTLTQDDREGIKWLYRYYTYDPDKGGFAHELSDCPEEYVYDEQETKGCVPANIFNFEFKYGTKHTIAEFMGDAQQTADHLRAAIMQGNMPVFELLLAELHKTKALIQRIIITITPDEMGRTVMHAAAWSYRRHGSKFYHLLIDEGMPDNVVSHVGITPRTIVEAKDIASLYDKSVWLYDNLTRLRRAVATGDTDAAQQVLTALRTAAALRINVLYNKRDIWQSEESLTLLHRAASNGHAEIVALLLEQAEIEVNTQNIDGDTALIAAARHGHIEVAVRLLAHADIDTSIKNKDGYTAATVATLNGHVEMFELLQQ